MIQTLIGKKIDQTQMFLENGRRIPVTEIAMQDNTVVQTKTDEKDTYSSVQLGYGAKKKPTKALLGHVKKAKLQTVPSVLREVLLTGLSAEAMPQPGDIITVETVFKPGDVVKVVGTSKGKGFAGGVKRHGFRGGPKTHGQSDRHRAPGSIGQTTTPGRVYKGKRMAGRMGHETVSVTNLTVVDVDAIGKKLYVLGLVPGNKEGIVFVVKTGEQKKFVPLLKLKDEKVVEESVKSADEAKDVEVAESASEAPVEEKVADEVSEEKKEGGK